jgi:hypothetical protein
MDFVPKALNSTIQWGVKPYSVVKVNTRFEGTCCLHLHDGREAYEISLSSSLFGLHKTSVNLYPATRRHAQSYQDPFRRNSSSCCLHTLNAVWPSTQRL